MLVGCVSELTASLFCSVLIDLIITHAGCIAAGVGRAFSHVCLFVRALKGKWLELSTPNLVHNYTYTL